LIDSNFSRNPFTKSISALGENNGYQHLWLTAKSTPNKGLAQVTWLNNNGRFYTQSAIVDGNTQALFTRIGANDPHFNLRNEAAFIYRKENTKAHTFVSVLEPHGEYNPAKEFTLSATSSVVNLDYQEAQNLDIVEISLTDKQQYLLVINNKNTTSTAFTYQNNDYQLNGRLTLIKIKNKQ